MHWLLFLKGSIKRYSDISLSISLCLVNQYLKEMNGTQIGITATVIKKKVP